MTVIAGRTYSEHLVLTGMENAPVVAHSARRTLGGRMVVQAKPIDAGGRQLMLTSENHLTQEDIDELRAVAMLGQTVLLEHARGSFDVLITRIEVEPMWEIADPGSDTLYSGSIYLQEK